MSATAKAARVEAVRTEAAAEDVAIFSAYTITATFWLLFTTAVGLLVSFKFPYPDWATSPLLSFGRLRAIHTNGTFYGWATIALVGSSLYVAARASGVALVAKRWAWIGLWNGANADAHIRIVLHGLSGKVIGGTHYSAQMPPFASQLSDAQIAAVVDHERTSWQNHGPIVTPEEVKRNR